MPVDNGRFTPQARRLWEALEESERRSVLSNVWCPVCMQTGEIASYQGRVVQGDVVLSGVCSCCGGDVSSLVETGRAALAELAERCRPFFTGEVRERKHIPAGTRVPVLLAEADRDLIAEHAWGSSELRSALDAATVDGAALRLDLTMDELDELAGWIAAAANHEERRTLRRRLASVCSRRAWLSRRLHRGLTPATHPPRQP